MKSKYIASSHSFQEQPELQKPDLEDYNGDHFLFYGPLKRYEEHVKSLRLIPCRPGDNWQEGVLYEEGKDYTVAKEWTDIDGNDDYFLSIVSIKSLSPPTTEQSELWLEAIAEIRSAETERTLRPFDSKDIGLRLSSLLTEKYTISLRNALIERTPKDGTDFEFITWLVGQFDVNEFDDEPTYSGIWGGVVRDDWTTAELYQEFQLYKKQKP